MPAPSEPEVVRIANRFVRALREDEAAATRAMARQYLKTYEQAAKGYTGLWREVEALRKAGQDVPPDAIRRMERYQDMMAQTQTQLRAAAATSERQIAGLQADALRAGMEMAEAQVKALTPATISIQFNRLPLGALEQMVGFLSNGAPLKMLLDELGTQTSREIADLLVQALAMGWNPRKTAREIRKTTGMGLTRAMRIARTEQLRAWRRSSMTGYRDQPVIKGYRRHAQKDERTCIACLLRDGEFYETEAEFTDHVQGRCAVIPVTQSWEELGIRGVPDTNAQWQTGADWFKEQDPATQRSIVGDPLFDAWKGREIALEDMAYLHRSQVWGDSWQAASLKRARLAAEQRRLGG